MRLAVLVALFPCAAFAEANVSGDPALFARIEAGIVCASGTRTPVAAPDTVAGFIEMIDGPIVVGRPARRVPALPGLSFGVVAEVRPDAGAEGVTITVTHPPMAPDNMTRQSWITSLTPGDIAGNFFTFDTPEELLPGQWTMQASRAGQVFYTAGFEVVDPALMPAFTDPCAPPAPIS